MTEGFENYIGFDISEIGIDLAKKRIQNSTFLKSKDYSQQKIDSILYVGNALDPNNYLQEYNAVVCLEVLEHIEEDLEIIKNIKSGTDIIFSVPNFNQESHVRFFKNINSIKERYNNLLKINSIATFKLQNIFIGFIRKFLLKREPPIQILYFVYCKKIE